MKAAASPLARRDGDIIVLDVLDSGVGLTGGTCTGFGLPQVRERLQAAYGNLATIYLGAASACITGASITFPSKNEPKMPEI